MAHSFSIGLVIGLAVTSLGGCAFKQKALNIKLVDGCLIELSGISQTTIKDVVEQWEFARDCELKVDGVKVE